MGIRFLAAAIAGLSLFLMPVPAFAGSVSNGSFESGAYSFNGQGAHSLGAGSTVITDWVAFGAELAVINNTNSFNLHTPYGNIFLDLTGYHDGSPYGGIQQSIATVAGQSYTLSLYLGVNNSNGDSHGPISVLVTAGSHSATLTANPSGPGDIWTEETFTFTADSTTTLIQIQGTSANGHFIGLDNVSISDNTVATPEPASIGMFGMGAVGVLGLIRRRRNANLLSRA